MVGVALGQGACRAAGGGAAGRGAEVAEEGEREEPSGAAALEDAGGVRRLRRPASGRGPAVKALPGLALHGVKPIDLSISPCVPAVETACWSLRSPVQSSSS